MPTPMDESIPCQTVSTAMKNGWAWKIPLTSRYGNGYVYSSSFCSADEAERELREELGLLESDTPARHLKMRIGRGTKHWNRNCLAVGLAQGFIEPLEATALLFIQKTAEGIVEYLESGDFSDAAHDRFNERINAHFEGTRDYIVTHYKTNSRTDTEYWRANAANMNLSEPLKQLYGLWQSAGRIVPPSCASRAAATRTRSSRGTASWPEWASSRTGRTCGRPTPASAATAWRKSTTCLRAARGTSGITGRCWKRYRPARRRVAADLFLVTATAVTTLPRSAQDSFAWSRCSFATSMFRTPLPRLGDIVPSTPRRFSGMCAKTLLARLEDVMLEQRSPRLAELRGQRADVEQACSRQSMAEAVGRRRPARRPTSS